MSKFKYKKGVQAVNFLTQLSGGAESKMKIVKILWLAERLHLRKYGRPITFDKYYALEYGPVPSSTLNLINGNFDWVDEKSIVYRNEFIELSSDNNALVHSVKHADLNVFSKTDEDALRFAFSVLRTSSAAELSNYSHRFPEWAKWQEALNDSEKSNRFEMDHADFFTNVDFEDVLSGENDEELLSINKDNYEYVESVRKILC